MFAYSNAFGCAGHGGCVRAPPACGCATASAVPASLRPALRLCHERCVAATKSRFVPRLLSLLLIEVPQIRRRFALFHRHQVAVAREEITLAVDFDMAVAFGAVFLRKIVFFARG